MGGVLNMREILPRMDESQGWKCCLDGDNPVACASIHPSVTNGEKSPPGEGRSMKSNVGFGTFRGSVFFLIFLSTATPTLGQSAGDATAPQTQQPAPTPEAKSAAPADASKVIQTK